MVHSERIRARMQYSNNEISREEFEKIMHENPLPEPKSLTKEEEYDHWYANLVAKDG